MPATRPPAHDPPADHDRSANHERSADHHRSRERPGGRRRRHGRRPDAFLAERTRLFRIAYRIWRSPLD